MLSLLLFYHLSENDCKREVFGNSQNLCGFHFNYFSVIGMLETFIILVVFQIFFSIKITFFWKQDLEMISQEVVRLSKLVNTNGEVTVKTNTESKVPKTEEVVG